MAGVRKKRSELKLRYVWHREAGCTQPVYNGCNIAEDLWVTVCIPITKRFPVLRRVRRWRGPEQVGRGRDAVVHNPEGPEDGRDDVRELTRSGAIELGRMEAVLLWPQARKAKLSARAVKVLRATQLCGC